MLAPLNELPTLVRNILLAALACAFVSAAAACDESTGRNCLYISAPRVLTPAEIKQKELEEQRRKEEARREQQRIDDELARRGWPKTREPEIRRFFELQKSAAAAGPKPGAGSALQEEADDAQTRWLKKNLDAQKPSPSTAVERAAYPEAILVCTKPDGAGRFRCLTPVDVIHGHPGDKQWNSPDAVAAWAQASCPGGRRLPSTTHLVWGCGFGATNNSNSMDRSAGVDVAGRATYYCAPKETSCRRTSN